MSDPTQAPDQLDGDLHSLSDDEYFEALAAMPAVRDADGSPVDVTGDVQDRRAEKAAAAAAGQEWTP